MPNRLIIPLVTRVLVELVVKRPHRDFAPPGLGVRRRVVDRELLQHGLLVDATVWGSAEIPRSLHRHDPTTSAHNPCVLINMVRIVDPEGLALKKVYLAYKDSLSYVQAWIILHPVGLKSC